jgi:hypothetical protein
VPQPSCLSRLCGMPGFELRRTNGRWSFRAQGCCGNLPAWEREYERAFAEQVLGDGGESSGRPKGSRASWTNGGSGAPSRPPSQARWTPAALWAT